MATVTSRRSPLKNSAATLAAAGLGGKLVRAQDAPIRIGVIYDLSGPFAAAGSVPCAIGAQIAIDIVNERGGSPAYKVQPINADCKARRMLPSDEVERLINQRRSNRARRLCSAHAAAQPPRSRAEEDLLDHHGDSDLGSRTKIVNTRVPRPDLPDQYGQAFAAVCRGQRQSEARGRGKGCQSHDPARGRTLRGRRSAGDVEHLRQRTRRAARACWKAIRERPDLLFAGDEAQARRGRCHFPLDTTPTSLYSCAKPARPGCASRCWSATAPASQLDKLLRNLRQRRRQFLQYRSGPRAAAQSASLTPGLEAISPR